MHSQTMVNRDYEPSDGEEQVLDILKDGRANPIYIREQTGLDKGNVEYFLNQLTTAGWVRKLTTGLYEFKEDPREDGDE